MKARTRRAMASMWDVAFQAGHRAQRDGRDRHENPYAVTSFRKAWFDGYDTARMDAEADRILKTAVSSSDADTPGCNQVSAS